MNPVNFKITGKTTRVPLLGSAGFTLVEILVALALTGLVMVSVYKAMTGHQKIHSVQDQAVDMQENLRAAMDFMVKDLRIAGCDPLATGIPTVLTATAGTIRFTMDIAGGAGGSGIAGFADGAVDDTDEDITYSLFTDADGTQCIGRTSGGSTIAVARNIQAIEFYYTLANGTKTLTPATPSDVRVVQISVLARNSLQDKDYINKTTYTTASGATWGPYNNGYRRRLLTNVVRLRNMGFK